MMIASLLGFVAFSWAQDYPHRDWGKSAVLNMTVDEASACVTRQLSRRSDATLIPVEGGADIDVAPHTWPKSEPWRTYKVRAADGRSTLQALYRRPFKRSMIDKEVSKMEGACLKISKQATEAN